MEEKRMEMVGMATTYTTMRTIGPTTLLGRLVDLDMLHDQIPRVEPLGIGVGLGVLEQAEEELGGFLGPARAGDAELFACCRSSNPFVSIHPTM